MHHRIVRRSPSGVPAAIQARDGFIIGRVRPECATPPPCGIWPDILRSSRLCSGAAGKTRRPRAFLDQGGVVGRRIEAEHRQLEAVLPFRLAVTAGGVAAKAAQDRQHVAGVADAAWLRRPRDLDGDRKALALDLDTNRGSTIGDRLNHSLGVDAHRWIFRPIMGSAGQINGAAIGGLAVNQQRLANVQTVQLNGGRIDLDRDRAASLEGGRRTIRGSAAASFCWNSGPEEGTDCEQKAKAAHDLCCLLGQCSLGVGANTGRSLLQWYQIAGRGANGICLNLRRRNALVPSQARHVC